MRTPFDGAVAVAAETGSEATSSSWRAKRSQPESQLWPRGLTTRVMLRRPAQPVVWKHAPGWTRVARTGAVLACFETRPLRVAPQHDAVGGSPAGARQGRDSSFSRALSSPEACDEIEGRGTPGRRHRWLCNPPATRRPARRFLSGPSARHGSGCSPSRAGLGHLAATLRRAGPEGPAAQHRHACAPAVVPGGRMRPGLPSARFANPDPQAPIPSHANDAS